jgi:hypothetical protein
LGFWIAFAGPAPFLLLDKTLPELDWWKIWEMTVGTIAGLSVAVVYLIRKENSARRRTFAGKISDSLAVFLVLNWALLNSMRVLSDSIKNENIQMLRWIVFAIVLIASFIPDSSIER